MLTLKSSTSKASTKATKAEWEQVVHVADSGFDDMRLSELRVTVKQEATVRTFAILLFSKKKNCWLF